MFIAIKRTIIIGLLGAISLLFCGCNGVFFQPDQIIRPGPESLGLQHQSTQITTKDGHVLSAWHIFSKAPKIGTLIHFHGNAENMTAHFQFVYWLAEIGFDIITFDYRGYGNSKGEPSRAGLHEDGKTALGFMESLNQDYVIIAQSLGGAISIPALVVEQPKHVKALVLESTFASYRGLARRKLGSVWLTWPLQYPLSFLVTDELSPIEFTSQVKLPLVVIHGTEDPVIPYDEGQRLYQSFTGEKKLFWTIAGGGHTPGLAFGNLAFRKELLSFLCDAFDAQKKCRATALPRLEAIAKERGWDPPAEGDLPNQAQPPSD